MSRTIATAASVTLACCAIGAPHAQVPAKKGQSPERKAAAPSRGNWDLNKGTSGSRKKPDAGARSTTKPRQGLESNGTTAQGTARD
jgi:hypothetical protein